MPDVPHHPEDLTIRRREVVAGGLAVLASLLSACSANLGSNGAPQAGIEPQTPADGSAVRGGARGPVKVALLLPLAGFGPAATVAKALKQAGEMALFERDNPNVQLLVKDDGGTPQGAQAAADQAIRDGAEIILGPLQSASVSAIAPQARKANVPVLAFSNDPRVAGSGIYLVSFLIEPEVERIISYAISRGKRRIAALIPADAYGDTVEPAFRAAVTRGGGMLAHLERYPVGANAMLDPAKRVADAIRNAEGSGAPIDALFLPGGQETLPQLAPLLAYHGVDPRRVQFLGSGAWDYPNIGREQMLAGGWYPGPDPRGWQDFSARFSRTFGSAPPRLASLAHDAVGIAVMLSSGVPGQRYATAALTSPAGFAGVDGTLVLKPNGLSQRQLAVIEIQQYGNNVIDAAASGFAGADAAPVAASAGGFAPGTSSRQGAPAVTGSVYMPPISGSVYVPPSRGY